MTFFRSTIIQLRNIREAQYVTEQEAQDEVMGLLEEISGKPVILQAEPSLTFHATITTAREILPAHVLLYRPELEPELPYLACFQCGFAIRSFQLPAADRFDLVGTETAEAHVGRLITEHHRRKNHSLPSPYTEQLQQQLLHGLGSQFRSMPIGMRVDAWLHDKYPSLHKMQRTAAVRQLNEAAAALAPSIREMSPKKIFEANVSMNAAFALFWSRLWNDTTVVTPYKASGHISNGEALLASFDTISSEPVRDRELIAAWMEKFDLGSWYKFVSRN